MKNLAAFYALILLTSGLCFSQLESIPVEVQMKDKSMDKVVDKSATMNKLVTGFRFTEGPAWTPWGTLLFSDIPANTIYELDASLDTSTFMKPSGHSNGLTFTPDGKLIICEHDGRLSSLDKKDNYTVLADKYNGKRLNSPNDVVIKSDGSLYFTDPPYGLKGQDKSPDKELPYNGIYRLKNGEITLLYKNMTRPNGIAFSPDEKFLYVANSDPKEKYWLVFPVNDDGTLGKEKELYRIAQSKGNGVPDGLKVDLDGNIYCTEYEGIWVFTPEGKVLGIIKVPEVPANIGWGGADLQTLYITARNSIYSIRLNKKGYIPYME